MSFQGQINFGYPITSQNIITDIPDNAVLPLSMGSSLQGNILGVTFETLKSQISSIPVWGTIIGNINDQNDLMSIINGKQPLLFSGSNIKTINGNSILGEGNLTVGVTDGDKGDVTVSGGGTTWTVDNLPQSRINNLTSDLAGKQATLTSGSNIKTINSTSLLGSGDLAVQPTLISGTNIKTINGSSILGSGNLAVGLPDFIEYDESNKTLWNNGYNNSSSNLSYGQYALATNISGANNVSIGFQTLYNLTTATGNTAVGNEALRVTNTNNSTAIGFAALRSNITGLENIAVGYQALYTNISAGYNSAFGFQSLYNNTTGNWNTGVGHSTLLSNTTGSSNIAIGPSALTSNTTGNNNTALGYTTLLSNSTGSNNVAIGHQAMFMKETGDFNTAIGQLALTNQASGSGNTALGRAAGQSITTGQFNVFVGYNSASLNVTTGTSNVFIGASSTASANVSSSIVIGSSATATASNQLVIGSASNNAGAITTETITPNRTWTVRINGADYKIPLLAI